MSEVLPSAAVRAKFPELMDRVERTGDRISVLHDQHRVASVNRPSATYRPR